MKMVQMENRTLHGSFFKEGFQEANQSDSGIETIRRLDEDKGIMQGNTFFPFVELTIRL
jgi:hypothetical protein